MFLLFLLNTRETERQCVQSAVCSSNETEGPSSVLWIASYLIIFQTKFLQLNSLRCCKQEMMQCGSGGTADWLWGANILPGQTEGANFGGIWSFFSGEFSFFQFPLKSPGKMSWTGMKNIEPCRDYTDCVALARLVNMRPCNNSCNYQCNCCSCTAPPPVSSLANCDWLCIFSGSN